ncbi:MAG: hypothetical protein E7081_03545 [Bacteroidales bacterium]|nr:hypothetical protein [Bacteroidales bacterium]
MRNFLIALFISLSIPQIYASDSILVVNPTAWTVIDPLGLRKVASIDTLLHNYYLRSVPSDVSSAFATTGNLGAEGLNMIYFDRKPISDFFFRDALSVWLPNSSTLKFYNTPMPMTLLSYNTGGGKETAQDRLEATFSGNINKRTQVGAMLDYLYSKGSYNYQATKDLTWGASGSYIGDRYELQAYFYHYNLLNKENGGITDDRYITDPAEVQGGSTSVDTKNIPTNLSDAHTRLKGTDLYINNRYKLGYWDEEKVGDSIISRKYIPVTSFVWTLNFKNNSHIFRSSVSSENSKFFSNTYLNASKTIDETSYWSLSNTFGISLLEGFHRYAKAGLSAFITHQIRKYNQMSDSIVPGIDGADKLTPFPFDLNTIPSNKKENLVWVGGQLTKQHGDLLRYNVTAKFGVLGDVIGDIDIKGDVTTRFKLFGDTVKITGNGWLKNEEAPYLMKQYVSNHFIWNNDFAKTRNYRLGGKLDIPHTGSVLSVGVENIENHIYFNDQCLPVQHDGNVQVFSASLQQSLKLGILNWDNKLTYQTTSNEQVIPIPSFAIYSNLYLLFKVAKVLDVQCGIDCDYYTKYKSVAYQPATMSFYNQNEIEIGNYPFMNAYINMKLSKTRFYVLFSHINQGWFDNNYFSMPHYPLNPRKFQIGISVDLAN